MYASTDLPILPLCRACAPGRWYHTADPFDPLWTDESPSNGEVGRVLHRAGLFLPYCILKQNPAGEVPLLLPADRNWTSTQPTQQELVSCKGQHKPNAREQRRPAMPYCRISPV